MSEIYSFYIDKAKNNKNSNHIDVNIPYPIIANNKEKLSIKMIDFKYLNNVYNISSALQNNTITLRKERDTYNPTIISQERLPLDTIFFKADPITNLNDNVVAEYLVPLNKQVLTSGNYKITYFSDNITNNINKVKNIFIETNQTNKITNFIAPTSYFILETSTIQDMVITGYSFAVNNSVSANATIKTFIITIEGSNDNITYTTIPKTETTGNDVIFQIYTNIPNFTKETTNAYRDLTNNQSYKYYKVSFTTSTTFDLSSFTLSNLQFRYAPYNLVLSTVPTTPLNIQMTIPEGFYKSSTFIKTINDLLEPHYIKATLSPLTNKIELLNTFPNQNTVSTLTYTSHIVSLPTAIMLFNNENIKTTYGINKDDIVLEKLILYIADNNINLTNFSKLIITSSLNFHNKTHNEIVQGSDNATGIGNVLTCIDNDEVPFSYIKYTNHEMIQQKLGNKNISNVRFSFYNERSNEVYLSDAFIHFQIIKSKK